MIRPDPVMPVILPGSRQRKGVGATYAQFDPRKVGAQWMYNWGLNPPVWPGVEAVPMIWGEGSAGKALGGQSPWVMWFNEPDIAAQANLNTDQSADLWNKHIDDYPGRFYLSPSVFHLDWLAVWLRKVDRKPDGLGIHPYVNPGMPDPLGQFRRTIEQACALAEQYRIRQVWITEYALVSCYPHEIEAFMPAASNVIRQFPMVTRYAWFQLSYSGREPWGFPQYANLSLVDYETGEPTRLGRLYVFDASVNVRPSRSRS